jgi:hypothetical protein
MTSQDISPIICRTQRLDRPSQIRIGSTVKAFLLFAVFLMISCESIPMQESYAPSVEKRMQASEHWKVLAKQIAEEVEKSINAHTLCQN